MVGLSLYFYQESRNVLKIATYLYFMLSALSLVTWINLQSLWTRFPWFVYPILTLGLGLIIWYMWQVYLVRHWYHYSLVVGINLTLQALFTWAFIKPTADSWPWWLVVGGAFAVLTLVLYLRTHGLFCCPLLEATEANKPATPKPLDSENPPNQAPQDDTSISGYFSKALLDAFLRR